MCQHAQAIHMPDSVTNLLDLKRPFLSDIGHRELPTIFWLMDKRVETSFCERVVLFVLFFQFYFPKEAFSLFHSFNFLPSNKTQTLKKHRGFDQYKTLNSNREERNEQSADLQKPEKRQPWSVVDKRAPVDTVPPPPPLLFLLLLYLLLLLLLYPLLLQWRFVVSAKKLLLKLRLIRWSSCAHHVSTLHSSLSSRPQWMAMDSSSRRTESFSPSQVDLPPGNLNSQFFFFFLCALLIVLKMEDEKVWSDKKSDCYVRGEWAFDISVGMEDERLLCAWKTRHCYMMGRWEIVMRVEKWQIAMWVWRWEIVMRVEDERLLCNGKCGKWNLTNGKPK